MARLACLIAEMKDGSFAALEIGRGPDVTKVIALRKKVIADGLTVKIGKEEEHISVLHCLANHVRGGELKARVTSVAIERGKRVLAENKKRADKAKKEAADKAKADKATDSAKK